MISRISSIFILFLSLQHVQSKQNLWPLSLIHVNDFHARFEETNNKSGSCADLSTCIGGYSRMLWMAKHLMEQQKDNNPYWLNIGDNFQGTPWFNLFGTNVTAHFLNFYPPDFMTIGNHEFDNGLEGLVDFIMKMKEKMILIANMDMSSHMEAQNRTSQFAINEKYGRPVCFFGMISEHTGNLSNTGDAVFHKEVETAKKVTESLTTSFKCKIIVLLSHCGIDADLRIAQEAGEHIDVIVGGHSHTFLYTGTSYPGPDKRLDSSHVYPMVIKRPDNHKVLVVQAASYAKYVGNLTVYFDDDGEAQEWEGNPVFLGHDAPKDPEVEAEIQRWKVDVDKVTEREVGVAAVDLDATKCKRAECNLGNLVVDSMLAAFPNETNDGANLFAIINGGGIRASIGKGKIKYGDLLTVVPFYCTVDLITLPGRLFRTIFEHSVHRDNVKEYREFLQISQLKVRFDLARPSGQRVQHLWAKRGGKYVDFDESKEYKVVISSFLGRGGDGFHWFKTNRTSIRHGPVDMVALERYVGKLMKEKGEIRPKIESRIIIRNRKKKSWSARNIISF